MNSLSSNSGSGKAYPSVRGNGNLYDFCDYIKKNLHTCLSDTYEFILIIGNHWSAFVVESMLAITLIWLNAKYLKF